MAIHRLTSLPADAYVYVLFRLDGSPFYVGKGRGKRWLDHEKGSRRNLLSHKSNIIRQMLTEGAAEVPKVKVAEGLTHAQANACEIALIAAIGRHPNGPLVNITPGGEGNTDPSPEQREATRERNRTRVWTEESRARAAAALLGKKLSPETIAKRTAAMVGRVRSPEHCAAISARSLGKPHTAEHTANVANAKRGKPLPPISAAHRAAIGAAHRGKVVSAETRAKMSASARRRWGVAADPLLT